MILQPLQFSFSQIISGLVEMGSTLIRTQMGFHYQEKIMLFIFLLKIFKDGDFFAKAEMAEVLFCIFYQFYPRRLKCCWTTYSSLVNSMMLAVPWLVWEFLFHFSWGEGEDVLYFLIPHYQNPSVKILEQCYHGSFFFEMIT